MVEVLGLLLTGLVLGVSIGGALGASSLKNLRTSMTQGYNQLLTQAQSLSMDNLILHSEVDYLRALHNRPQVLNHRPYSGRQYLQ
jgi:uncharacterized protein YbjQ (UPF0145 family)